MQSHYETFQPDQAKAYLESHTEGEFTLLDVREDWEYEEFRIPGATHIPLSELGDRVKEIAKDKPVLAYCRAGGRSAAAASLLKGQDYPVVYNIMGGVDAWQGGSAVGPATAGLAAIPADASIEDIIAVACRMEVNLGKFYEAQAEQAEDSETAATLKKLAGFEDKHKNWLLIIYRQLTGQELDGTFLTDSLADGDQPLEGGLTAEEFMELNQPWLDEPVSVVETGMMFETQALDLYMRYANKVEDKESRDLLQKLAQEEKAHLKALGTLLKRIGG
ncbi:sulfurtransferase [Desulfovibrio ferrophilus]|uniref:Sulfurtransferase n=2 Tax=Desulfovibrio ferrophilus TaxID=241368 RepID=A0A2Z6AXR6_9BACT|nr:sulfurtransferase [Desulfovibrio ferrophilus]